MTWATPTWRYPFQSFTAEETAFLEATGRLGPLTRGPWSDIRALLHTHIRWFPTPRDLATARPDPGDRGLRRLPDEADAVLARLQTLYLRTYGADSLEHASSLVLPVDTVPAPLLGRSRIHWIARSQRLLAFATTHVLRLQRDLAAEDARPVPEHMIRGAADAIRQLGLMPVGVTASTASITDDAILIVLERLYEVRLTEPEQQIKAALFVAEVRLRLIGR